jgi:RNA polymerase sigma factor (sigma-70 family)
MGSGVIIIPMNLSYGESTAVITGEPSALLSYDDALAAAEEHWLIEDAKTADPEAFAALYGMHAAVVRNNVYGHTQNPADIEDVVQDVFFNVWRNMGGLTDTSRGLGPYLGRTVTNLLINKYREESRHPASNIALEDISETDHTTARSTEDTVVGMLEALETLRQWKTTLRSPDLLDALVGPELIASNQELAKRFGVDIATIYSRRSKARRILHLPKLQRESSSEASVV